MYASRQWRTLMLVRRGVLKNEVINVAFEVISDAFLLGSLLGPP